MKIKPAFNVKLGELYEESGFFRQKELCGSHKAVRNCRYLYHRGTTADKKMNQQQFLANVKLMISLEPKGPLMLYT